MKKLLSLFALTAILSACGGDGADTVATTGAGSTDSPGNNGAANAMPAGGPLDSFVSQVLAVFDNTSDTAEPIAVDTAAVTTPEESEPAPVS